MNQPLKLIPLSPYALGSISVQRVERVVLGIHVAMRDAIVEKLSAVGYKVVGEAPSSIGGLMTLTVEGSAEDKKLMAWAAEFRGNLERAVTPAWEQKQRDIHAQQQSS